MSVTLITPTGSRPEAFALCERFIERQTYKGPIQWIVIDDSPKNPTKCTLGQEYYVGPMEWREGLNTQRYNLAFALPKVKGDYILLPEDDDFFHPQFIEVYLDFLKHVALVGEGDCTYYSLKTKGYLEMNNFKHASTTQTAFRKSSIPFFEKALHSGEKYFDIVLWNNAKAGRIKNILFSGLGLCVGMKGLPGRNGIGVGHSSNNFTLDPDLSKLKQLVGLDFKLYEKWL